MSRKAVISPRKPLTARLLLARVGEKVSWRFGGYLHNLKKKGVDWEKERIPNTESQVFKYRLVSVDE